MDNTGGTARDATANTPQAKSKRFEGLIPTRVSPASAAIAVTLAVAFIIAFITAWVFLPTVALLGLCGAVGLLAAGFVTSRILNARATLHARDPLNQLGKVHGPKEAWKELSSLVGVTQEETLSAQIKVAKLLAKKYPQEFDKRVMHAVLQSNFIPLVRAYRQIDEGTIIAPEWERVIGSKAPRFPGEMEAAGQSRTQAWQALATLVEQPGLRDGSESRERLVSALVEKFPNGLSPINVISAGIADVLYEVVQAYVYADAYTYTQERQAAQKRAAQREYLISTAPAPTAPRQGPTAPNPPKKLHPSSMTHEQAWNSVVATVGLMPQAETQAARIVVADRLVSQFPNGLGHYAIVAAKARLTEMIRLRYDEKGAERDARVTRPSKQSLEL
ncbi:MAG TPA: hypothetical protein VFE17_07500 [Candidatus Baltobacteraceae bacterium]|jgi:hypothetical protein|nr:hypothetical protein [Candidatus Baltobacteraceae bacterium]